MLFRSRQEAQSLVVNAEQEMDRLYRAALAEATAAANASREAARRQIDVERDKALAELDHQAGVLSEQIVSRLLPTP